MLLNMDIQWVYNRDARRPVEQKTETEFLSPPVIKGVRGFHQSFPQYHPTPLHDLNSLAKELGIRSLWVKDESYRFGLNAFKVLGGAYAIGKYLSNQLGFDIQNTSFEALNSMEVREKLGEIIFVTATDGNHGRGIAWAAAQLGQKSVVYMPKGSAQSRLESIRKEGAEASITELNYDDAVRLADAHAQQYGWVTVQDTAWEGYEDIPTWIMQGYGTIMDEVMEQLGDDRPTHVILQAGVGSFAGAMQGYLAAAFGDDRPITVIVEPNEADCIYQSAKVGDGRPHAVTGHMNTIMAGLACGEPNIISWEILRDYSDLYISCPDYVAARGMRIMANPIGNDPKIVSGESGAVGLGLASILLQKDRYKELREKINLHEESRILVISTEGDTDPLGYRNILWNGAYPYEEK